MNVKGERCGPCSDAGFKDVLAHYKGVKAGLSPTGKEQPAMCWEHYHGEIPKHMKNAKPTPEGAIVKANPLSLDAIKLGIDGDKQMIQFLNDLMRDVTSGAVDPDQAKTVCAVADRIIKIAELRLKLEMSKR